MKASVCVVSGPVTVRVYPESRQACGSPTYLLDLGMPQWPSHELVGVPADRIKHLGEALIALHGQLAQQPSASQ